MYLIISYKSFVQKRLFENYINILRISQNITSLCCQLRYVFIWRLYLPEFNNAPFSFYCNYNSILSYINGISLLIEQTLNASELIVPKLRSKWGGRGGGGGGKKLKWIKQFVDHWNIDSFNNMQLNLILHINQSCLHTSAYCLS